MLGGIAVCGVNEISERSHCISIDRLLLFADLCIFFKVLGLRDQILSCCKSAQLPSSVDLYQLASCGPDPHCVYFLFTNAWIAPCVGIECDLLACHR